MLRSLLSNFYKNRQNPALLQEIIGFRKYQTALGEAQFKPLPYGNKYIIKCEVPGFLPYLLNDYKMVKGKINKVDILLVRAA
ncbi:MAG: hypothetical protein IPM82_04380 [Saprospiraceae bacterium]|nr:hypothetical protein [Saprospiraceae bacterium]